MSPTDPFPTVARLAVECGAEWPAYAKAAEATATAEGQLRQALIGAQTEGRLSDPDSSLVICGSFARHEMTDGSDCDWTLLIDGVVNSQHGKFARNIDAAIKTSGLEDPGTSGTFGNLAFSHDLVHRIGGTADTNENLTRRMLMLLESRPFEISDGDQSPQVWENVISNILDRYFEEDVHFSAAGKCRVPRFLLNDLTRYWRTICVDYAAKHWEQDGKKWAIRNAKLRFSRKLIYASGLAFCLSCELDPPQEDFGLFGTQDADGPQPFIRSAKEFAKTPTLEFLAKFVVAFVSNDEKRKRIAELIFGSYHEWMLIVGSSEKRSILQTLSHENAIGDPVFEAVRKHGSNFATGLRLLFFNREDDLESPIANLSLDYVGF